jgi:glycosyltransferase involved in cell wall biosynthesis
MNDLFISALGIWIDLKRYDIVHTIGQSNSIVSLLNKQKHAKIFHSLHELEDHLRKTPIDGRLFRYLEKESVPVILHSQNSKASALHHPNIRNNKSIVLPFGSFNGYRYIAPRSLGLPDDKPIVVAFGYAVKYKGYDLLLEALRAVPPEINHFRLVIAGCGWVEELAELAKDDRCILFNRFLSNGEVVDLFSHARWIICPYRSSSQTGIVSTAAVFSVPVAATRVGAFSELIYPGLNGLFLDGVDSLTQLFRDVSDGSDAATFDRSAMAKYLSWETQGSMLEKFYAGSFQEGEPAS